MRYAFYVQGSIYPFENFTVKIEKTLFCKIIANPSFHRMFFKCFNIG